MHVSSYPDVAQLSLGERMGAAPIPVPSTSLNASTDGNPDHARTYTDRTVAAPTRTPTLLTRTLQIGVTCNKVDGRDREHCDHVLATVDAINNKTDGFFDQLLPNTLITTATARVGCAATPSLVPESMERLFSELPDTVALIGLQCSDDVGDTYAWAAHHNKTMPVVLSTESRAPVLADETKYPNLARFTPNEHTFNQAFVSVLAHYDLKRVGLLADDTVWAQGALASLRKELRAGERVGLRV